MHTTAAVVVPQRLVDAIVKLLKVNEGEVVSSANFVDDLGGDSLTVIELVLIAEDVFKVPVPEGDEGNFYTVGEMLAYLKAKGVEFEQ